MANTRAQVLAEETAAQDRSSLRVLVTSELQNEFSEQVKEVRSVCQNHYGGYRINFPRFNGVRLSDWLFKAEQFFSLDMTPDDLKVKVASSHFDDLAATWHQSIEELILWKHVKHDWVTYKLMLEGKYNKHVEDSIAELKKLQETEGIEEYHAHFELTSTRVELAEDYLVSLYLTGLQKDTQMNVRMFQPKSIQQCLMLGRLYETAHRKKFPTPDCYDCRTSDLGNQREAGTVVGMENLLQQQEVICEQTYPQKLVTTETVAATETMGGTKSIEILEWSDVSLELDLHEAVCSSRGEITRFILEMVDWCEQPTSVKTKHCAHQCFDKWPTMAMVQQKKPKEKSLKCWKFKFKPEKEDMHQQHSQIFYVFNCGNNIGFDHHEKELHVFDGVVMNVSFQHSTRLSSRLQSKKKKICYKTWMLKYKAPLKSIHDKLGKPKDRGALLIQQFQIKHKWRFKPLMSILALEIYLDSLVLVTNYAHQCHRLGLIILMGVGMFTNLRSQLRL